MAFVGSSTGWEGSAVYTAQPGDQVVAIVVGVASWVTPPISAPGWRVVGSAGISSESGLYFAYVLHRVEPAAGDRGSLGYSLGGLFVAGSQCEVMVYRGPLMLQRVAKAMGYTAQPLFGALPDAIGVGDVVRVIMADTAALPAGDTTRTDSYFIAAGDRVGQTGPIGSATAGYAEGRQWVTFTLFLGPRPVSIPVLVAPGVADGDGLIPVSWQTIPGQSAVSVRRRQGAGAWAYLDSAGVWVAGQQWLTTSAPAVDLPGMSNPVLWEVQVAVRVGTDDSSWSASRMIQARVSPPAPSTIVVSSLTVRRPSVSASGAAGSGNVVTGYEIELWADGVLVEAGVAPAGGAWQPTRMPDGPVTVVARTVVEGGLTGPPTTLDVTVAVPAVPPPDVVAVAHTHPVSGLPGVRLMISVPVEASYGLEVQPEGRDVLVGTVSGGVAVDDYEPAPAYLVRVVDEARDPVEASAWVEVETIAAEWPPVTFSPLTTAQDAQAQWLIDPQRPELALLLRAREDGGLAWDMSADRTRYRGAQVETVTYRDRMAATGGTTTVWLQGRTDYDGLLALLALQAPLVYRWPSSTDGTPGRVDRMLVTEAALPRFDPGINHDIWPATLSWGPAETHLEDDPWL